MAENDRIRFGTNETTGEPSYLYGDAPVAVIGGVGSGKTFLMRQLVKQIDRGGRPQVVIDLKMNSGNADIAQHETTLEQVLETSGALGFMTGSDPLLPRSGLGIEPHSGVHLISASQQHARYTGSRFEDAFRALVSSAIRSFSGQEGVLHIDEAWMAGFGKNHGGLGSLLDEARGDKVRVFLYTHEATELFPGISDKRVARGIVLANKNQADAQSALSALGFDPSTTAVARVTGEATIGGFPNYNSLRHQTESGNHSRGTVGFYTAPDGSTQTAIIAETV